MCRQVIDAIAVVSLGPRVQTVRNSEGEMQKNNQRKEVTMKLTNVVTMLALCAGLAACSQQENPAPPAAPAETPKAQAPAAAPAEMPKAEMPAAPVAAPAAADVSAQAQAVIDKVKEHVANKDYTGAMSSLKELSAMKLTPDQQTVVDDLKAQVQKALAGAATPDLGKSAGDLLGK
jgi:hypothetical protein